MATEQGPQAMQIEHSKDSRIDKNEDLTPETITTRHPPWMLPTIIVCQFGGTALWFSGNAILPELSEDLDLPDSALGLVSSSVQAGFILGTLLFAAGSVADRFLPTRVFFTCACLSAACNVGVVYVVNDLIGLLVLRFLTGVCLAGIYPVGMKIASDWVRDGLGRALGWLVGALVLGTAFPFILQTGLSDMGWGMILLTTSALSAASGFIMGWIPNGPYRKASTTTVVFSFSHLWHLIRDHDDLRAAAMGYWGHMWELYAFWALVPAVWEDLVVDLDVSWNVDALSFGIIAVGAIGCGVGGEISMRIGSARVAFFSLAVSGLCCLLSPIARRLPPWLALALYLVWGMAVVADSAQFSTLVAKAAPASSKGSALTLVNCVGFTMTIGSIQLLSGLLQVLDTAWLYIFLFPGPLFGLWFLKNLLPRNIPDTKDPRNVPDTKDDEHPRITGRPPKIDLRACPKST